MASLIFRKGLDLKHAVAGMLADNYHSGLVEQIKADDFTFNAGRLIVHLAREFGSATAWIARSTTRISPRALSVAEVSSPGRSSTTRT